MKRLLLSLLAVGLLACNNVVLLAMNNQEEITTTNPVETEKEEEITTTNFEEEEEEITITKPVVKTENKEEEKQQPSEETKNELEKANQELENLIKDYNNAVEAILKTKAIYKLNIADKDLPQKLMASSSELSTDLDAINKGTEEVKALYKKYFALSLEKLQPSRFSQLMAKAWGFGKKGANGYVNNIHNAGKDKKIKMKDKDGNETEQNTLLNTLNFTVPFTKGYIKATDALTGLGIAGVIGVLAYWKGADAVKLGKQVPGATVSTGKFLKSYSVNAIHNNSTKLANWTAPVAA